MDEQVEAYKRESLKTLVDMFNKGYQLGKQACGKKPVRKIKVVEVGHEDEMMYSPQIDFARLDDGTIHNYGRSFPF